MGCTDEEVKDEIVAAFTKQSQLHLEWVLITKKVSRKRMDGYMFEYVLNTSVCRRDVFFHHFDTYRHVDMGSLCLCCDICGELCKCNACHSNCHVCFMSLL